MKKLKIFTLAIMATIFNSMSVFGQTTKKPDLNILTPIVGGIVVKYQINADNKDTVYSRIELSATPFFLNNQIFYSEKISDTIKQYIDTITEKMGIAPAPADYYVRIWTVSKNRNDSLVSTTSRVITLEPVQNPILSVIQVLPHQSGCYFSMNMFSGNTVEKLAVQYKYSYDSINWFPGGATNNFIGTLKSVNDSITGLFANKKTYLKISYANSKNVGDTAFSFITTLVPTKPVLEIIEVIKGVDQIEIKGKVTTFGVETSLSYKNGINTFKSLKSEPFSYVIKNLQPNTMVIDTITATNSKGSTFLIWSDKTIPAPIEPKLVVNSVYIGTGKAMINWSWQTNSDNLFTRVDAKFYSDKDETMPIKIIQISEGSPNQSGSNTTEIDLEKGIYWVRLVGETQKSEYQRSNLFEFQIKWNLGVDDLGLPTGPVVCNIYNGSGQLIKKNFTIVNPRVNFSEYSFPFGIYTARPVDQTLMPFKVVNREW